MVFGEGITNDAVSIILFDTVVRFAKPGAEINFALPFKILGSFTSLAVLSLIVGILIGALSATLYKKVRLLTEKTVMECTIIFCFAYLAYCLAELINCSGIISLLTCGIMMGHYTWHNLSP